MDPIQKQSSLTDQAAEAVRAAITSGVWTPGEVHSVGEVSNLLGVSRTPAREALLQLAREGLIEFERSVGFRVRARTYTEIAEIFHMRLLLECPAMRTAATAPEPDLIAQMRREHEQMYDAADRRDAASFMTHDLKFHEIALSAAGNQRLIDTVQQLRDATASLGAPVHRSEWTLRDIANEHEPILEAIDAGDPDAAERAARLHIAHAATILLGWSDAPPPEANDNPLVKELWTVLRQEDEGAVKAGRASCIVLSPMGP